MLTYVEVTLNVSPFQPWSEIFVSHLADLGYESFVEENPLLKAYIPVASFDEEAVNDLIVSCLAEASFSVDWTYLEIPPVNWNENWEKSFEPVQVGDLSIVAPFHGSEHRKKWVIEIEPKMSFGTGHHQTTFLMCQTMHQLVFAEKKVLDMGSGTGILAIYSEMLGAKAISAVDIEPWAVENSLENIARNNCHAIKVSLGDIANVSEADFDIVLANINKNILRLHLPTYAQKMVSHGDLLLSGFFTADNQELIELATSLNFTLQHIYEKENWSCLHFKKC